MAASADNINNIFDPPPFHNDISQKEENLSPVSFTGGQWQSYFTEKVPIYLKLIWRGKLIHRIKLTGLKIFILCQKFSVIIFFLSFFYV